MARAFSFAMLGALLLVSSHSHATTYNLTADWSTSSYSNGVWSYRGDNTVLPTFFANHLLDGNSGVWAPANVGGNFLPGFFKATDSLLGFGWQIGDVVTHTPDAANGNPFINSNVLFTAPNAGTANISGSVWNARTSTPFRPQFWQLYVNGVLQDSESLPGDGSNGRASPDTFNLLSVLLAAGDTVELRMFRTDLVNTSTGDYVGMDLTVDLNASAVPLPPAMALFATGLGVMGLLGWRRRRNAQRPA
jgi:hypothetical protein